MLSKCANPECSEVFRYLHQGKIFHLSPTLEAQATSAALNPSLHERFWLCAQCSKQMKLIWDGTEVKLVRLPVETGQESPPLRNAMIKKGRPRGRAASGGRDDE